MITVLNSLLESTHFSLFVSFTLLYLNIKAIQIEFWGFLLPLFVLIPLLNVALGLKPFVMFSPKY